MKIIAHRGCWKKNQEKNTFDAFKLALEQGFGIETDLRDFCSEIVISHDIPNRDSMTLNEFLRLVHEINANVTLALNIKSDGQQQLLGQELLLKGLNVFYFDMSIPDCLAYKNSKLPYYTRFSDIETTPCLYEESIGIWLDCFGSNELNTEALEKFIHDGKRVSLVSPELHGFEYLTYWESLRSFLRSLPIATKRIELCTDHPLDAKEYFCE
ncbi:hypothetical protein GNP44_05010 [Aliivibrio fischeri]|uniref:hypothetical protein n=1 Tax=Aliivibrio fischeri TaxID=668 RepID=UPI0012D93C61|nr:hypothetical protein [Aliivibrio fischeri]MUK29462.1 hypothetical protein [Aliivibrio fischeri]